LSGLPNNQETIKKEHQTIRSYHLSRVKKKQNIQVFATFHGIRGVLETLAQEKVAAKAHWFYYF